MKFRKAERKDVPAIVAMIADDKLGATREQFQDPLPESYYAAFERISQDPHQELVAVEDEEGNVVGTMQLSYITYLTYRGGTRAQIEAVRIHKDHRGAGLGERMFRWAIARAKARRAHVVQLTTDKKRPDALRFYEKLGFVASHEGMKLHLKQED